MKSTCISLLLNETLILDFTCLKQYCRWHFMILMDWILNFLILEYCPFTVSQYCMLENWNSISAKTLKIPIIHSTITNSFPIAKLLNFYFVKTINHDSLFIWFHHEGWQEGETSFHKPLQEELDPLVTPLKDARLRKLYSKTGVASFKNTALVLKCSTIVCLTLLVLLCGVVLCHDNCLQNRFKVA